MQSEHTPSLVGFLGIIGTLTLSDVNALVAILVGLTSFAYLIIKILKELKDKDEWMATYLMVCSRRLYNYCYRLIKNALQPRKFKWQGKNPFWFS